MNETPEGSFLADMETTPKRAASLRAVKRVCPYIWAQRWLLLLALVLIGLNSLSVILLRTVIPAVFFDGVLVSRDSGGSSFLTEKLGPFLKPLGLFQKTPQEEFKLRSVFSDLKILGGKEVREPRRGVRVFEDGEASFTAEVRQPEGKVHRFVHEEIPFTSLRVEPSNGEHGPHPDPSSRFIASGELRLEYKPVRMDASKLKVLQFLVILGLSLCVAVAVFTFWQKYLQQYFIQHVLADLRRDLIAHMSTLSLSFYHRKSRGDLLSRVSNDIGKVSHSLQLVFGDLLEKPILFLNATVVILWLNWKLALIVLAAFPFLYVLMVKSGKQVRKRSRKQSKKRGLMTTSLEQLFSGIRTVKSFNMESSEREHFQEKNMGLVREVLRTNRTKILANTAVEMSSYLAIVAALGVGGYLLISGRLELSVGTLVAFLAGINTMYTPVKTFAKAYTTFQDSMGSMERVLEVFDSRPTVVEFPGAQPLPPFRSSIRYENVSFSYGREPVLEEVSLEMPAGTVTAVVGPTGSGKSTLVDLLMRFYDPTEGRILIDGHDIAKVSIDSLTSQIAVVSQEPFLFDTTIRRNIRYGKPDASEDEIEAAAVAANIHDFITSLPEGYATKIGDRGVMLSGGQRQRITIARAILKNAPILILDEATSSLDTESEATVQDALEKLMRVRSTIAIAHRLSTIQHADNIIVLDQGRVVESGTFSQLLEQRGLFCNLYDMQFRNLREKRMSLEKESALPPANSATL